MHRCAESVEAIGFVVQDRVEVPLAERVGGLEPGSPPGFELPGDKGPLLQESLVAVGSRRYADTDIISTLLGVWVWGALINWDLLSPLRYLSVRPRIP